MSEIPDLIRLLDWLPLPAFVQCRQGVLRYANAALRSRAGVSIDNYLGRSMAEMLPKTAVHRLAEEDQLVFAGEIVHSEITFQLTGGIHVKLFVSKQRAEHPQWGEVLVGVGQDFKQWRASERDETTMLLKHELQGPLSGIAGLADLLLSSSPNAEQHESLQIIRSTAGACLSLLADITDAKLSVDKWTVRPTEFLLREFLADVLKPFELRAQARHLRFSYLVADQLSDRVYGDPLRLRQVLENLVWNALKFTEAGVVDVSVVGISQYRGSAGIQFSVRDTGIGISEEERLQISELLDQRQGSPMKRNGRTGLGLAIASHIVRLLNGRIWVESEPSRGSIFSFIVPSRNPGGADVGDGFDRKAALAVAGGDAELLRELAELFLQEYPKLIANLRAAVQERNATKLDGSAHALKGAVANFGARAAVDAALSLEARGRSGEMAGVEQALASLEQIFESLLVELAAL
jgi:signal transduction histidine kinase/HPt (histidine-containing phosphotransfer) domain-containing protein